MYGTTAAGRGTEIGGGGLAAPGSQRHRLGFPPSFTPLSVVGRVRSMADALEDGEEADGDVVVRIRDLSISSGGSRALDRLTLDVHRGERLGVVVDGSESASTLAYALLNAVPGGSEPTGELTYVPEAGEPIDVLALDGRDLRHFRWEAVSIVEGDGFESFNPATSVRAHFAETLRAHGADVEAGLERAKRLLSTFDLDPDRVLVASPNELGGVERRTRLALALLLDPDVLVLDDLRPTTEVERARAPLEELGRSEGTALLALGEELAPIAALAERLAVVREGRVVEVGPTDDVLEDPTHPFTRSLVEYWRGPD